MTNPPLKDIAGQVFGRLTVLRLAPKDLSLRQGGRRWVVRCECGTEKVVRADNLRKGNVRSCGCLAREESARRNEMKRGHALSHGHAIGGRVSPEYASWAAMHQRCRTPTHRSFPKYGGRGVTICERWASFENFIADMGPRPEGATLDRFPNNAGNYEPGNCRWATASEQSTNRRSTVFVDHGGDRLSITQVAERVGMDRRYLSRWLRRGLSVDQVIERHRTCAALPA